MEVEVLILFIYGASGVGIEIYDQAERSNQIDHKYSNIILIDDFEEETTYYGTRRIHFDSCAEYVEDEEAEFIVAVGEPTSRKILANKIKNNGYKMATLVDKTAIVSPTAKLFPGCIVGAGAIVSSEATLDENCMVLYQAIVGHHAHVGRNTVICPKSTVGGHSNVGENCFIGISSSMKQGVNLGKDVIVGMGAMVFRDVEDGATVVGNPARVTKGNDDHKVFS